MNKGIQYKGSLAWLKIEIKYLLHFKWIENIEIYLKLK